MLATAQHASPFTLTTAELYVLAATAIILVILFTALVIKDTRHAR